MHVGWAQSYLLYIATGQRVAVWCSWIAYHNFMTTIKDKIALGFSKAAAEYEQFALVQRCSIESFHKRIISLKGQLPAGPVLEVGCGTGALSRILATEMPDRQLLFTDFSAGMLAMCRQRLSDLPKPEHQAWQIMDGENIAAQDEYALIASSLTLQWFNNPTQALQRACRVLQKGGKLFYSYVGEESFTEWRTICDRFKIPCTANPMPDTHRLNYEIRNFFSTIETWGDTVRIKYPQVKDFFYSLKKTGSGTQLNKRSLPVKQMRELIKKWDNELLGEELEMTYNIQYILAEK